METAVTRDEFRTHARIDFYDEAEDSYIDHLLVAAQEMAVTYTHRTRAELETMGGGRLPEGIRHAIMLTAAHWYNQRESVSAVQTHAVPETTQALLKPYRRLSR